MNGNDETGEDKEPDAARFCADAFAHSRSHNGRHIP
jgi:hypothetical protein